MKILVFDNYDSFTYNLVNYVEQCTDAPVTVARNDEISLEAVDEFDKILLSPGPGLPSESGLLLQLIRQYAPRKSILGVCLGQQAMAEAFGGRLLNLGRPFHGVATRIKIDDPSELLFRDVPTMFLAGRYHSWVVDKDHLPDCFRITATDETGEIMGITHREFDLRGVQFHPESILTEHGLTMIRNWVNG
ncbi:MAG: aminodeoxychorismate/anthranilate synthase component II [Saprospiraceae bacterium]|nr:aminodeoxychorismate/anthranilate synthase component II [Saprospiraceae bacterium]